MKKKRLRFFEIIIFLLFLNTNAQEQKIVWEKDELLSKHLYELRIIRNEFFARKGYVFKSEDLNKHFEDKKWYVPKENVELNFTETEKGTIKLIQEIEKLKEKEALSFLEPYDGERRDTVLIDYNKNKVILEALAILPFEYMGSWEWSQKDRKRVVKFIKEHNYIIDSDAIFLTINHISSHSVSFRIIDGSWCLSVYPINDEESIIITNDIVTGGNSISSYRLKNGILKDINLDKLLYQNVDKLLKNRSEECIAIFEEISSFFDYSFNGKDILEISSWDIKNEEKRDCFAGDTILLKFNKDKVVFDIQNISWE